MIESTALCTVCGRRQLGLGRHACEPCQGRMEATLRDAPELAALAWADAAGRSRSPMGERTRGGEHHGLPVDLDALSMAGPSSDAAGPDQDGRVPWVGRVAGWCVLVAEQRGLHGPRRADLATLCAWLRPHIPWCCTREWVPDLAEELRTLRRDLEGRAGTTPRQRRLRDVPCGGCGIAGTLVLWDDAEQARCCACGATYEIDELAAWGADAIGGAA